MLTRNIVYAQSESFDRNFILPSMPGECRINNIHVWKSIFYAFVSHANKQIWNNLISHINISPRGHFCDIKLCCSIVTIIIFIVIASLSWLCSGMMIIFFVTTKISRNALLGKCWPVKLSHNSFAFIHVTCFLLAITRENNRLAITSSSENYFFCLMLYWVPIVWEGSKRWNK
jgi:hypothetical protein